MNGKSRSDGRAADELRPVEIRTNFTKHAEGSVLIEVGDTRVICTASVQEKVPPFLYRSGSGWITAEYGMLPRATTERTEREAAKGKQGGRTMEIQRLIGRSLRAAVNHELLGERTIWIDCDVIQADGGTRTASITGSYVALVLALGRLYMDGNMQNWPMVDFVAAVSVGIIGGVPLLDLNYAEDSKAGVDMNVVATDKGKFVELQGTAEGATFSEEEMQAMLGLAKSGIAQLIEKQREALAPILARVDSVARDRLKRKFARAAEGRTALRDRRISLELAANPHGWEPPRFDGVPSAHASMRRMSARITTRTRRPADPRGGRPRTSLAQKPSESTASTRRVPRLLPEGRRSRERGHSRGWADAARPSVRSSIRATRARC